MSNPIYCFEYVPPNNQPKTIRFIDLDQIVAVGLFVEGDIIGIQIDCKHRDAPLVIEMLTKPQLVDLEVAKVNIAAAALVEAWVARRFELSKKV